MSSAWRCGGHKSSPADDGKHLLDIRVVIECGAPEELVIQWGDTLIEHQVVELGLRLLCDIEVMLERQGGAQHGLGRGERRHGRSLHTFPEFGAADATDGAAFLFVGDLETTFEGELLY